MAGLKCFAINMLAKPTPEQLQSLQELDRRGACADAVAYIEAERNRLRALNDGELKTKVLRMRQGACQALTYLLKNIRGPQAA